VPLKKKKNIGRFIFDISRSYGRSKVGVVTFHRPPTGGHVTVSFKQSMAAFLFKEICDRCSTMLHLSKSFEDNTVIVAGVRYYLEDMNTYSAQ
jgi:hypothetical protein